MCNKKYTSFFVIILDMFSICEFITLYSIIWRHKLINRETWNKSCFGSVSNNSNNVLPCIRLRQSLIGSKGNKSNARLLFFYFHLAKITAKNEENIWIYFCKRKSSLRIIQEFVLDTFRRMLLFHHIHRRLWLTLGILEVKCHLKDDAIPTEYKPENLMGSAPQPKKRSVGKLSRIKVRPILSRNSTI